MSETLNGAENIRWDLTELYSGIDDPAIDETLENARQHASSFVKDYKGKVADLDPDQLAKAYDRLEELISPLYKLSQYVHLRFAIETLDDSIKALVARVEEAQSHISNQIVFFSLELGKLPPEKFELFKQTDVLSSYHYKLDKLQRNARYNLSEKEEQLINLKDLNGINAHQKLYNELTSSFQFEFEIDGKIQTLNGDQLRALRQHSDPDVRQRAMKLFFDRYAEHHLVFTHLYNSIVKDHGMEMSIRGYDSPISSMNSHNDLTDAAIQSLNDVTTESYSLVHRYYRLKQKLLGLDSMTLADIYAPLPEASRSYSFSEAQHLVLTAFGNFDKEFQDHTKRILEKQHLDAPAEAGKRGGAFCSSSTPDLDPYVMLNFTGKIRDVATMAHELGHALHAVYSSRQPLMNYHSILPLAETASIFSEMVLTDHFLKQESDPAVKISLLTNKLEDIFASSHRQNMFSRFELATHSRIAKNLQSSHDLCELYASELKLMFGDSVVITPEYHWEWSSIPHIYNVPFYVYAYNFGNLLVLGLYQKYLEDGKAFIPRYKEFLSLGSSASPADVTATVDADIQSDDFWRKSLTYINGLIDTLEGLVENPDK